MATQLRQHFLIFCGEFTGTAFLLFFGCLGCNEEPLSPIQAALSWGFTVTGVITIFGHISGCHINPCVTISALILGSIEPLTALVYFVAEMLGAIFGYYLVQIIIKEALLMTKPLSPDAAFCTTSLHSTLSLPLGVLCEFMATSLLIFAVCSIWDPRNAIWSDSVPIKLGLIVALLVFAIGKLTGASLNPARSFAPALLNRKWKNQWVFWVATLGGAVFSTVVYKLLFSIPLESEKKVKQITVSNSPRRSLIVEAKYPSSSTKKFESQVVSPEFKTEIAIQNEDRATISDNLPRKFFQQK